MQMGKDTKSLMTDIMKTNVFKILGILLVLVMGLAGCSDDKEDELTYYDEIEDEKVIAELDNVPAYVFDSFRDYVFVMLHRVRFHV